MSSRYVVNRIDQRICSFRTDRMYRVVDESFCYAQPGAKPTPSRFSDNNKKFAVLYASHSIECCFLEVIVRDRYTHRKKRELPKSEIIKRCVTSIRSIESLELLDIRGDGLVKISAPPAVSHDTSHAAGRSLSTVIHENFKEIDGFLYNSRLNDDTCIAIYCWSFQKIESLEQFPFITYAGFDNMLKEYDIELTPAP